jgi:hypothetical protein
MKETLIKLATGLIAKAIRYSLSVAGGGAALSAGGEGKPIDPEQLAAGIAAIAVSFGWSLWEDRVKKRQAEAQPFPPIGAGPQPQPNSNHSMKVLLLLCAFCSLSVSAIAEEKLPDELARPFDAGKFSLTPFAGYKITEIGKTTGKWAGGMALAYQPVDNIAIEASALSYQLEDSPVIETIDEAALNFKGYLPLGRSGFAPFGLMGYTRDHAQDRNLMNLGAGIAYRYKRVEVALEGQYRTTFEFEDRPSELLLRLAGGFTW